MKFIFLAGPGYLPKRAAYIAQRLNATLYNETDPNGGKFHWFEIDSTTMKNNWEIADKVAVELLKARLIKEEDF